MAKTVAVSVAKSVATKVNNGGHARMHGFTVVRAIDPTSDCYTRRFVEGAKIAFNPAIRARDAASLQAGNAAFLAYVLSK